VIATKIASSQLFVNSRAIKATITAFAAKQAVNITCDTNADTPKKCTSKPCKRSPVVDRKIHAEKTPRRELVRGVALSAHRTLANRPGHKEMSAAARSPRRPSPACQAQARQLCAVFSVAPCPRATPRARSVPSVAHADQPYECFCESIAL